MYGYATKRGKSSPDSVSFDTQEQIVRIERKRMRGVSWWRSPLVIDTHPDTFNFIQTPQTARDEKDFENGTHCADCKYPFKQIFGRVRHHCRVCAKSFCINCAPRKIFFWTQRKADKDKRKMRMFHVCKGCFEEKRRSYVPAFVLHAEGVGVSGLDDVKAGCAGTRTMKLILLRSVQRFFKNRNKPTAKRSSTYASGLKRFANQHNIPFFGSEDGEDIEDSEGSSGATSTKTDVADGGSTDPSPFVQIYLDSIEEIRHNLRRPSRLTVAWTTTDSRKRTVEVEFARAEQATMWWAAICRLKHEHRNDDAEGTADDPALILCTRIGRDQSLHLKQKSNAFVLSNRSVSWIPSEITGVRQTAEFFESADEEATGSDDDATSSASASGSDGGPERKKYRLLYSRPEFLGLCPRSVMRPSDGNHDDRTILSMPPGMKRYENIFGYAECRNAGKSPRNEDMPFFFEGKIRHKSGDERVYRLYGVMDGHGGWDLALAGSRIYRECLIGLIEDTTYTFDDLKKDSFDIVSAMHQAVAELHRRLEYISKFEYKSKKGFEGGAAFISVLEIEGIFWIASCGDCAASSFVVRNATTDKNDAAPAATKSSTSATAATAANENGDASSKRASTPTPTTGWIELKPTDSGSVLELTEPFTIFRERQRLQTIACRNPGVLKGAFCRRIFDPPKGRKRWKGSWIPQKTDIGLEVYCWDHYSSERIKTVVTKDDVFAIKSDADMIRTKMPMISGEKQYMRLLGITRCARGVGDFDLAACSASRNIQIRDFMSQQPEITCLVTESLAFARQISIRNDSLALMGTSPSAKRAWAFKKESSPGDVSSPSIALNAPVTLEERPGRMDSFGCAVQEHRKHLEPYDLKMLPNDDFARSQVRTPSSATGELRAYRTEMDAYDRMTVKTPPVEATSESSPSNLSNRIRKKRSVRCVFSLRGDAPDDDAMIVLASDGLWDVVGPKRSADIGRRAVRDFRSLKMADAKEAAGGVLNFVAKRLVDAARGKRESEEDAWPSPPEGGSLDDISVFVIRACALPS